MLGGGGGDIQATSAEFGGGEGLMRAGQALVSAGDRLLQIRERREAEDVRLFGTRATLDWVERMDTLRQSADPTGDNYVENFRGEFERYKTQTLEQYDHLGQAARADLEQRLTSLQTVNLRLAIRDQAELRSGYQKNQVNELGDDAMAAISNNPEVYDLTRDSMVDAVRALDMDENDRTAMLRELESNMAATYVDALIDGAASQSEVDQIMSVIGEDSELTDRLTGEHFAKLKGSAETRKRAIRTEQRSYAARAMSQMANARSLMSAGHQLDPALMRSIGGDIERAGEEGLDVAEDWRNLNSLQMTVADLRSLDFEQLAGAVSDLQGMVADGATPLEFDALRIAEALLDDRIGEMKAAQTALESAATDFWRVNGDVLSQDPDNVNPDILAEAAAYAHLTNDAGVNIRQALVEGGMEKAYEAATPEQLAGVLSQLSATTERDAADQMLLDIATQMLDRLERDLNDNVLGAYSTRQQEVTPLDLSGEPQEVADRIAERAAMVAQAESTYGRGADFFLPQEASRLAVDMQDWGVGERMAFAQMVVGNGGNLDQFADDLPELAQAGMMLAYDEALMSSAHKVMVAGNVVRQNGIGNMVNSADLVELRGRMAELMPSFSHMTDDTPSMFMDAVINVAATELNRKGSSPAETASGGIDEIIEDAIQTVAGRTKDANGEAVGGWSYDLGGVVIPRGVKEDDLASVIGDASYEEIITMTGGADPVYGIHLAPGVNMDDIPPVQGANIADPQLVMAPGHDNYYLRGRSGAYLINRDGSRTVFNLGADMIDGILAARRAQ
jgi:hypothetical protein